MRREVLQADRYECQICKAKYRRYRQADTVHHVNHLKTRPDLALEMYGYRKKKAEKPLTEERWD